MAGSVNSAAGELETAKWVAISTNLDGYENEFFDTRAEAEAVAADWSRDEDENLVVVAKIVTRYIGSCPPRIVKKTEVR